MGTGRSQRAVVVLVGLVVLTAACSGDDGGDTERAGTTTSAPTTTTVGGLPEVQDIDAAGGQAIEALPFADWVTIAGDSAWVANVGDGVGRYDLATGELVGSVPISPQICLAMDHGFESLWVGDCLTNTVARVDLASGEILAGIQLDGARLPSESSIAVDESGVWVLTAGAEPNLLRIDPVDNEVVETFAAPSEATAVRAGEGSLWVTRARTGQLVRVDPAADEVVARFGPPAGSGSVAADDDAVWISAHDVDTVWRLPID